MKVLETFDLTKKYKDSIAVNKVNMNIEKGDIYGFVGENGAGKTTVIRLITGLAHPTSGGYQLFGVDYDSNEIYNERAKMAAIVETVSLNKNFTALENLKFQCMILGITKSEEELIEIIKSVGLNYEAIKSKKSKDFSLGMRQRLGIATVMVQNPEFVVLDEPMNGLDPQGIVDVRDSIVQLANKGVTFLISSHILSELEKVCTKVGFISHGNLVEELTIEQLRAKEQSRLLIQTDNDEKFLKVLNEELNLKNISNEHGKIAIYDEIELSNLLSLAAKNKIEIKYINTVQGSIEEYYIEVMNRGVK